MMNRITPSMVAGLIGAMGFMAACMLIMRHVANNWLNDHRMIVTGVILLISTLAWFIFVCAVNRTTRM
jgi:hypothetical protein